MQVIILFLRPLIQKLSKYVINRLSILHYTLQSELKASNLYWNEIKINKFFLKLLNQ